MYGLLQTMQSPLQFDFVSQGFGQYFTNIGANQVGHLAPTSNKSGGVYISNNGLSPNIFNNNKGSVGISCVKTGATTGTLSSTPFNDSARVGTGSTTYTLTCTDNNTGQTYTQINGITWGAI